MIFSILNGLIFENWIFSFQWRVGDFCRAIYEGDGIMYEAKVVALYDDCCLVEYLGYEEEAEVKLDSLSLSEGKKARKKQVKTLRKNLAENEAVSLYSCCGHIVG